MKQLLDRVDKKTLKAVLAEELPGLAFRGAIRVAERLDKWVVALGDAYVMRVPKTTAHAEDMARERQVLLRLSGCISLHIPQPPHSGHRYAFDLYRRIPGVSLTQSAWDALPASQQEASAERIACFLAELHRALTLQDAKHFGLHAPTWPPPAVYIRERLIPHLRVVALTRFVHHILEQTEALATPIDALVVLHNDLALHNLVMEPQTQLVYGVLDFSDVALGDVHQEFQYMDSFRPRNAERIIRRYEALSGRALSQERITLYCTWTALGHAAFATEAPAARALASKLQWVEHVAKEAGVVLA